MIHVSSSGQASPRNSPRVLGHDRVDCVQRWLLPEFESFHLLDRLKHHRRDRVQQNCPRASGSNGVGWCERQGRGAAQLFLPPPPQLALQGSFLPEARTQELLVQVRERAALDCE